MQTRSFRGSGEPAWVIASSNACFRLGPDPRRALGPAASRAASTGRTHDRTRPMLHQRKKALVNQAPSTHDPKRILRNAQSQERLDISSGSRSGKLRLRRLSKFLQRRARWREERCAGVRGREIEQPVVSARRVADIHSLQHLLDHPKISRIADKIRAELQLPRTTERHVVAQYIIFVAAGIYDGRKRLVRFARRIVVINFNIVYFRSTNDLLLERGWNLRPRAEIV